MYNAKYIIPGLVVFLLLVTTPFWLNLGQEYEPPELQKAAKGETCVEDPDWMREQHMVLLDEWRDMVVREGKRIYINKKGVAYNASLQNTCMDCHRSMEEFCGKCHADASVDPYCWECHIAPEDKLTGSEGEGEAPADHGHEETHEGGSHG
jgi:hypothetical protein